MSTNDRDKKLEELFQLAVDVPRTGREDFFQRHCGDDPELLAELESLLRQDDDGTKDFLQSPVLAKSTTSAARPNSDTTRLGRRRESFSLPSERIGRYRILRKAGEGGMGTVYLAEQEEPVRREVALKIVKLGMDTERVVARFDNERQSLAMMDHPGIARIYDGGATDSGRPYFVMEYVEGRPISEFCDDGDLDIRQRLELFGRVCEAVQHAHQKGIIHRDIKPSNILVADRDGEALPKVIDFGIARAVDEVDPAERCTRDSEILGTCYYMSPEQADPGPIPIDTRTDIYSLGVLLYELLAGVLPFDSDSLRGKSASEVQEILRNTNPLSPSTKLSRLGDTATTVARHRGHNDSRTLIRRLTGDLDWITLRAMEKDPERRYATAGELAHDVRRHLRHEPILARRPSTLYQATKFVRRNRIAVAAAGVAAAALVVGTGLLWDGRQQLLEERNDLVAHRSTLVEVLGSTNEEAVLLPRAELLDVLGNAEDLIRDFVDDPEGEVNLRRVIAGAYHSMGHLRQAEEHLKHALDIQEDLGSVSDVERYGTMAQLLTVYGDGQSDGYVELGYQAADLASKILTESEGDLGRDLGDVTKSAESGDLERVRLALQNLRDGLDDSSGENPVVLVAADTLEFLGTHLSRDRSEPLAVVMLEQAYRIRLAGPRATDPRVLRNLEVLADALIHQGDALRAEELARESVELYESTFPEGHWLVCEARSLLGECLTEQGRYAEAEPYLADSHKLLLALRGPDSRATVLASLRLLRHLELTGEAEAAKDHQAALQSGFAAPWRSAAVARPTPVGADTRPQALALERRTQDAAPRMADTVRQEHAPLHDPFVVVDEPLDVARLMAHAAGQSDPYVDVDVFSALERSDSAASAARERRASAEVSDEERPNAERPTRPASFLRFAGVMPEGLRPAEEVLQVVEPVDHGPGLKNVDPYALFELLLHLVQTGQIDKAMQVLAMLDVLGIELPPDFWVLAQEKLDEMESQGNATQATQPGGAPSAHAIAGWMANTLGHPDVRRALVLRAVEEHLGRRVELEDLEREMVEEALAEHFPEERRRP